MASGPNSANENRRFRQIVVRVVSLQLVVLLLLGVLQIYYGH